MGLLPQSWCTHGTQLERGSPQTAHKGARGPREPRGSEAARVWQLWGCCTPARSRVRGAGHKNPGGESRVGRELPSVDRPQREGAEEATTLACLSLSAPAGLLGDCAQLEAKDGESVVIRPDQLSGLRGGEERGEWVRVLAALFKPQDGCSEPDSTKSEAKEASGFQSAPGAWGAAPPCTQLSCCPWFHPFWSRHRVADQRCFFI